MAAAIASSVAITSSGSSTVSDGPEPGREYRRHALVGCPAHAEVAGRDLLQEYPQLHVVRLVDAELAPDVFDLLGIRNLAGKQVRGIAADEVE
jgi:hypothetical protein